jgi:hypothetical protein
MGNLGQRVRPGPTMPIQVMGDSACQSDPQISSRPFGRPLSGFDGCGTELSSN